MPETVEASSGSKENYEPVSKRVITMKHIKCIGRYIFGETFFHFLTCIFSSPLALRPVCVSVFDCQPCLCPW